MIVREKRPDYNFNDCCSSVSVFVLCGSVMVSACLLAVRRSSRWSTVDGTRKALHDLPSVPWLHARRRRHPRHSEGGRCKQNGGNKSSQNTDVQHFTKLV